MSDDGCGSLIRSSFLVELGAIDLVLDTAIKDWVADLFFSFSRFFYHGSDCADLFFFLFFYFFFWGFLS